MNIKKSLIEKKNVVNMLSLILLGVDTNKKISETLKRKESTISEHLSHLNKKGITFTRKNKKNNEKNYEVNCEKIAEIFLGNYLGDKELLKYRKNDFVTLTFAGIISGKKGLMEIDPKKFDRVSLLDIFFETMRYFYYQSKTLEQGDEFKALQKYKTDDKKIMDEYKDFLKLYYKKIKTKIEEEIRKDEEKKLKEGKILAEKIVLKNSKASSPE